jgi:hypothetical protein
LALAALFAGLDIDLGVGFIVGFGGVAGFGGYGDDGVEFEVDFGGLGVGYCGGGVRKQNKEGG